MGRVLVFREGEPFAGDRGGESLFGQALAPVFFGEQKGQDGAA